MPSDRFLKAEVGLQSTFGTSVTPTIQVPFTGSYECRDVWHEAPWDAGAWTPTTIRAKMATEAQARFTGSAMFEMLPVLWNSGYNDVDPTGTGPYAHTYNISPSAVGLPKPLTGYFGAVGTNIGATGPAMVLKDLYLRTWRLSGNVNGDKNVALEAEFFGTSVNDNGGAGTAFVGCSLPGAMEVIKALQGSLNLDDAGTTGGVFTTMTALSASLLDWELNGITGIEPAYSGDGNILTFGGIRYTAPTTTLRLAARLSSANYALIYSKYTAGTYQELQLTLSGASSRSLDIKMTGIWTECRTAHARSNNEVVIEATFTAQTPHTQTTTPHYLTLTVNSMHNWT